MSNESSASAPNLEWRGHHINHQWSKGFEAERLLRDGTVRTYSGQALPMRASSILLHGDTHGAVTLASNIRAAVEASGAQIVPLSRHAT